MAQIHAYLNFNGNCSEAMHFYKQCLGGELELQTIGASPLAVRMPSNMQSLILHASLSSAGLTLLASDMVPGQGLQKGNAMSLSLSCSSEDELRKCYYELSNGGNADHPLEQSFWGALFGDLTDRYGHHWILNHKKN